MRSPTVSIWSATIRHCEARHLIFYGNYYFEAIKPVGSEIVSEARLVRHARRINAEMSGYDLADLDVYLALHGRTSKSNQQVIVARQGARKSQMGGKVVNLICG
jgi:hypothetical protein